MEDAAPTTEDVDVPGEDAAAIALLERKLWDAVARRAGQLRPDATADADAHTSFKDVAQRLKAIYDGADLPVPARLAPTLTAAAENSALPKPGPPGPAGPPGPSS